MPNLNAEEIQARREYHREWRKNHPDNIRETQLRYWSKKAREADRQRAGDLTGHTGQINSGRDKVNE